MRKVNSFHAEDQDWDKTINLFGLHEASNKRQEGIQSMNQYSLDFYDVSDEQNNNPIFCLNAFFCSWFIKRLKRLKIVPIQNIACKIDHGLWTQLGSCVAIYFCDDGFQFGIMLGCVRHVGFVIATRDPHLDRCAFSSTFNYTARRIRLTDLLLHFPLLKNWFPFYELRFFKKFPVH